MDADKDMLDRAEQFQRLFVAPMVDAVNANMKVHLDAMDGKLSGLVTTISSQETRIKTLESNQGKAMKGFAVYATGVGLVTAACWAWIKKKLFA
jgi:hypothetical protein